MKDRLDEGIDLGGWLGRKQAFSGIAGRCTAADANCLRVIRDQKKYKATGLNWDDFCKRKMGISRGYADRLIQMLNEFGESYFYLSGLIPIAAEDYRLISCHVTGEEVMVDGAAVKIAPQNIADLTTAVESLKQQARLALPAPAPAEPKKQRKAAKDPLCQAVDQLQSEVEKLESLLVEGPGAHDRASLMTVISGSVQRLGRIDRRLRG